VAVREFNGTSDQIICATGALSTMTFGTVAAIVKTPAVDGTFRQFFAPHDSGGTFIGGVNVHSAGGVEWFAGASVTGGTVPVNTWALLVIRKATGTATPRLSIYNFTSTTWTHTNLSASIANWSAFGASGTIRMSFQNSGDWFKSRIAVRGAWTNSLPWSADASGDTALQSAGLHTSAANWLSNNASAFWLFNQTSTATPVDDLSTTGTADQSSITGTTVVTGDDPPGFDFTLGGAAAVLRYPAFPGFRLARFRRILPTPFQLLGSRELATAAGFSGTASLTVTATSTATGQVQGTSSLTATATATSTGTAQGSASFIATATITASGTLGGGDFSGTASLTDTATITAAGGAQGSASLTETATVTAAGQTTGTASLTGTATITANGGMEADPNQAPIRTPAIFPGFFGQPPRAVFQLQGDRTTITGFVGDATLTVTASITATGTAQGSASLTETASITASATGDFTGTASQTVTAATTAAGTAQGTASLTVTATITAAGALGVLTGTASLTETATVTTAGQTTGTASRSTTATTTAVGGGAGTASLTVTANRTAVGAAQGAPSLTVTTTITATGNLSTTGSVSVSVMATITAVGFMPAVYGMGSAGHSAGATGGAGRATAVSGRAGQALVGSGRSGRG
jgi:hypothetical protein